MSLFKNMNVQLVGGVISAVVIIGGVIYAKISRKSARGSIPSEMKAARLVKFVEEKKGITNEHIQLATIPTPVPKAGEVLVKMEASPINPSDLSSLQGTYNSAQKEALPCSLGFEGAGTVVQSGGGFMGSMVLGKRCAVVTKGGGCMWAEYAIVPALQAVPLPADVSFEEGCSVFVNPLTVAAFVEIAQKGGHKAILHTAAASALGKMLVRYGQRNGLEIINVVRRPEQKAVLEKIGARHVIVSSDEKWQTQLEAECKALNCRIAFDAVAGDLTGQILKCMPNKSTVHVYGGLSMQSAGQVRPTDLIFYEKTVTGFWLTPFLRARNPLAIKSLISKVVARLKDDFKTDFAGRYNLKQVAEACSSYVKNMTDGKVLIKCSEF